LRSDDDTTTNSHGKGGRTHGRVKRGGDKRRKKFVARHHETALKRFSQGRKGEEGEENVDHDGGPVLQPVPYEVVTCPGVQRNERGEEMSTRLGKDMVVWEGRSVNLRQGGSPRSGKLRKLRLTKES